MEENDNNMEQYIANFDSFEKALVYDFNVGSGGIGDCLKFFMFILESCIKTNTRLYYKRNHIAIEKFIKLKYDKMYLSDYCGVEVVNPFMYYTTVVYNTTIPIRDVFYFSEEVTNNCILPITNYISVHVRLGDKYLETDKDFVVCKEDVREFSEEKMYKFIEENENIFFCCDNKDYKLKIKEKYNHVFITECDIGHTSLSNTTEKQVLDGITEFYIMTNSKMIYAASLSGFPIVASKFNNIPLIGP
jgi:hypothetical protein